MRNQVSCNLTVQIITLLFVNTLVVNVTNQVNDEYLNYIQLKGKPVLSLCFMRVKGDKK